MTKWDLALGLILSQTLPHCLSCFASKVLKGVGSQVPFMLTLQKGRESALSERLPTQSFVLGRAWKLAVKLCNFPSFIR